MRSESLVQILFHLFSPFIGLTITPPYQAHLVIGAGEVADIGSAAIDGDVLINNGSYRRDGHRHSILDGFRQALQAGDEICMLADAENREVTFIKNGVTFPPKPANTSPEGFHFVINLDAAGDFVTMVEVE